MVVCSLVGGAVELGVRLTRARCLELVWIELHALNPVKCIYVGRSKATVWVSRILAGRPGEQLPLRSALFPLY